jgi:hypothetical protein
VDLSAAIDHALLVLNWQENLPGDEMPPQWMWAFDDELELWFEDVEAKREAKYGGGSSGDEQAPMMGNELSAGRRRR